MGSGAAKHRGRRQSQGKKTSGKPGGYASQEKAASSFTASNFDPIMRSQTLQGWQSFPDQTHNSSLMQEARNTERYSFKWGNSARLRDKKVLFVSAGHLGMNKSESEGDHVDGGILEGDTPPEVANVTSQTEAVVMAPKGPLPTPEVSNLEFEHSHISMTEQVRRMKIAAEPIDSAPANPVRETARSNSRPRSMSKSSVTSEEEVILFGGRRGESRQPVLRRETSLSNIAITVAEKETTTIGETKLNQLPQNDPTLATTQPLFSQPPTGSGSSEDTKSAKHAFLGPTPNFGRRRGRARQPSNSKEDEEAPSASAASGPETRPPPSDAILEPKLSFGRRRGRRRGPSQREIEEEALIQDYIANMKDEESDEKDEEISDRNKHFRFFDGTGEANVKVQTRSRRERLPDALDEGLEWSSGDLEDFDDISTTDGEITEVGRVYADRMRPSGFQYLITAVGTGPSDARWVLGEKLMSTTAITQIWSFEERRKAKLGLQDDASDGPTTDSDESEALDDLRNTVESEEDENARLFERTTRMTDEQIARALNMQAELGMPTNEVLLFNGQEENEFTNDENFIPFSSRRRNSNRTRSKRNVRKDSFPSAEAFADALDQDPYTGFDVMDFDRPSLKPKRKGRKTAGLPFELEDEELAFQLQQSWENDRSKKAARKHEREEMRQAGLLGSKSTNGRVDQHTKYQESGMDAEHIRAEIRSFLVQEVEAMALAPMPADMRASVHLLARALKLKSHSLGKADGRFPILTKTPQTHAYTINNIWEVDALLNQRRFFPKNKSSFRTVKQPRGGPKARRSGGGGVFAGVSYMDGEVVGASAPEIGADNRGRAILERMGWSSGMGIGKVGNQGSTEVIKHVVKNTKAGLG